MRGIVSRSCRLLYVKGLQRAGELKGRMRQDAGLSTLEMLVLAAVVLAGAAVFAVAWNGKLEQLVADFKSS